MRRRFVSGIETWTQSCEFCHFFGGRTENRKNQRVLSIRFSPQPFVLHVGLVVLIWSCGLHWFDDAMMFQFFFSFTASSDIYIYIYLESFSSMIWSKFLWKRCFGKRSCTTLLPHLRLCFCHASATSLLVFLPRSCHIFAYASATLLTSLLVFLPRVSFFCATHLPGFLLPFC